MDIQTKQRLEKIYYHMIDRCYKEGAKSYKNYGGRGISICNEWLENVNNFVEWAIKNGYENTLCIDRIDNNGNYEPQNCRWVTIAENNQNRRSSRYFTINGVTKNLQQWCEFYSVPRSMVNKRLEMGWDIETALTTPKKERDISSLIGKRFERLTVLKFVGVDKHRYSLYECLCDCGNKVVVSENKLKTGHNRSCGCLKAEICYNATSTTSPQG